MLPTQQHTNYPLRRFLPTTAGAWALSILGTIAAMGTLYLSVNLLHATGGHSPRMALAYLFPIAVAALLIWATGLLPQLGTSRPAPLKRYLNPAWYLPVIALVIMALNLLGLQGKQIVMPTAGALFFVLITNLLVGVFEELLCRGFILNVLLHEAKRRGHSAWWAICGSSVIFGLMHLSNLINQPHLKIATTSQVLYAILGGIILGTIYYLSGSIWVVIIIHGVVDFFTSFAEVLTPPAAPQGVIPDATIGAALIQILILVPGVWLAWRALRKRTNGIHQAR